MGPKRSDYRRLENELNGREYGALLIRLQREHPFLRGFSSWGDAVSFMRGGVARDPRKDEVLRPILRAQREDRDVRWPTVLLVFFWPGLVSFYRRHKDWDNQSCTLWADLSWHFLQAVGRIDVERRPHRLAQKIVNDTFHDTRAQYRRDWGFQSFLAKKGEVPEVADLDAAFDREDAERRCDRRSRAERYRRLHEAGLISSLDLCVLIATRVYGWTDATCASRLGHSRDAIKKRRQRAESAVQRWIS